MAHRGLKRAIESRGEPVLKDAKLVGEIRVMKHPGRGKHLPALDGFVRVNPQSNGGKFWSQLSPFRLGPVALYEDYESKTLENAWQFAKLYREIDGKPMVDSAGKPLPAYFQWAKKGWADAKAHRRPAGRQLPICHYWDGDYLGKVAARRRIYAPLYAALAERTEAFQKLKTLHESGTNLLLVDFDGYDHVALGMSLQDVMDADRPMGHAFVLAMLLRGEPVWEDPAWQPSEAERAYLQQQLGQ